MLPTTFDGNQKQPLLLCKKYLQNAQVFQRQISPPGTERVSFSQEKRQSFEPQQLEWPIFGEQKML